MRLVRRVAAPECSGSALAAPSAERLAHRERREILTDVLARHDYFPLWDKQILEIDCGSGDMLQTMIDVGALEENIHGVERIPRLVAELRRRYPRAHLFCEPFDRLDFHDARFDLVVCSDVFSRMAGTAQAENLAREIRRVLQPGGAVIWYDARYPQPGRSFAGAVRRGEIRRLFRRSDVVVRTCTLLPSVASRLGPFSERIYPLLAAVPPLRSHYAGLIIPR